MNEKMSDAITELIATMKNDYTRFWDKKDLCNLEGYAYKQLQKFEEDVEVIVGRKYIKVVYDNCVWGFIVNTEKDDKFKYGDLLKAAGWNAPARNKPRGNIFEDLSWVRWTGPEYL